MISIIIEPRVNTIYGYINIDSYFFDKSQYEYAYYLYKNNERMDIVWYSQNTIVGFNVDDMSGEFYIKVFIKDKRDDDKRVFLSEVLSLNK